MLINTRRRQDGNKDQPEAEEDLPEMDRDLRDSDLQDRDLPATVTDRGEYLPSSVLPRREERLSSSV